MWSLRYLWLFSEDELFNSQKNFSKNWDTCRDLLGMNATLPSCAACPNLNDTGVHTVCWSVKPVQGFPISDQTRQLIGALHTSRGPPRVLQSEKTSLFCVNDPSVAIKAK